MQLPTPAGAFQDPQKIIDAQNAAIVPPHEFFTEAVYDQRATKGYHRRIDPAYGGEPGVDRKDKDGNLLAPDGFEIVPPAGHRVYKDRVFIRIYTPGDPKNIVVRPFGNPEQVAECVPGVRLDDMQRFGHTYEKWKAGQVNYQDGTPLEAMVEAHVLSKSQAQYLLDAKFFTVEALAEAPDAALQRVMGGQNYKNQARAFMERQNKSAPAEKLKAELEKRDEQISGLQAQIAEMQALMKAQLEAVKEEKPTPSKRKAE